MARSAKTHARTDTRGRYPEVGDTVIANVSGQLRAGIVRHIGGASRRNPEVGYGTISVELFPSARGAMSAGGHVSRIKDPTSVFVIRTGDCGEGDGGLMVGLAGSVEDDCAKRAASLSDAELRGGALSGTECEDWDPYK